jgi:hypothetical protein
MATFYTDPSIAQRAVVQPVNPLEVAAQAQGLKHLMLENRQGEMQQQQAQKTIDEQKYVYQVLGETSGDIDKAMPKLAGKVSPQTLSALQEFATKTRQSKEEELKLRREQGQQLAGIIAYGMQLPDDQYATEYPKLAAAAKEINPNLQLPDGVLPKEHLPSIGLGLMTQEMLYAGEEERRKKTGETRAQGNYDAELPGKKAKSGEEELQYVGQTLGATKSQMEWDSRRNFLKNRVSPETFAQIPAQWSRENAKAVGRMGMTPAEVTTADQGAQRISMESERLKIERARFEEEKSKNAMLYGTGSGQSGPDRMGLIDQIGQGKLSFNRLDQLLTKNPGLMADVVAKYPDFDSSKVKAYTKAYQDFTTGEESDQVIAGGVAMQHLKQLKDINDANPIEVRTPGTKAYNAYHNLLDTVTDELVTFYGEPKTNQVIESKKATLGALINRDAAIDEQAKAMGIRFDELEHKWKNAAPSKAYEAPLPGVSKEAQAARAALDPEYAKRAGAQNQPVDLGPAPPDKPEGSTGTLPDGTQVVVRGGRIVKR